MNDATTSATEAARCPTCGGSILVKYGRTKAGLQKYRCLTAKCGRQFVSGSEHRIDPEKKNIILALIADGVPSQTILKAVPGISRRWLTKLRRRVQTLRRRVLTA